MKKSSLTTEGLKNFNCERYEKELYNELIKSNVASASLMKSTGIEDFEYQKAEQMIKDTKNKL